jgi:hypothetical protein
LETSIVHVSDILVRARGVGFAGDYFVPAVHPAAWDMLRLSDEEIRTVLIQVEDSVSSGEEN